MGGGHNALNTGFNLQLIGELMRTHSEFVPVHKILIPFVHNGPGIHALEIWRHFEAEIVLVGVVVVPAQQSLSTAAPAARALRKQLRHYRKDERITSKSQIIVSYQPFAKGKTRSALP